MLDFGGGRVDEEAPLLLLLVTGRPTGKTAL
jgi:hypothetical protein